MRLLQHDGAGRISFTEDLTDEIPPYAILSHTWGPDSDEVSFADVISGTAPSKPGYDKILFCMRQAQTDELRHFWVDTCCINKLDDAELSQAINSMFRWYANAEKCYVYLPDVSRSLIESSGRDFRSEWELEFRKSRWFRRSWTLQELLAPKSVEFFSKEGERLGSKSSLERQISDITGIPIQALRKTPLAEFTVEERFSWQESRATKKEEDRYYSLLGVMDVSMPVIYGEGAEMARRRLEREIWDAAKVLRAEDFSVTFSLADIVEVDHFVARRDELEEIRRTLTSDGSRRCVVLHGLGGIGKTQLSIAYAVRYRHNYSAVFWLNIRDHDSVKSSFVKVAKQIRRDCPNAERLRSIDLSDIDTVVDAVKAWLCLPNNTRWLLIFDNYDCPKLPGDSDPEAVDLRGYLPEAHQGFIIITTRSSEVSLGRQLRIKKLNMQDSLEILANSSHRQDLLQDSHAESLAYKLDGLPLALATAGSYLHQTPAVSCADYLRLYETSWAKLQKLSISYEDRTLHSIWQISLHLIEKQNPLAANLLRLWAYFDNQDIWFELLRHLSVNTPEWLQELTTDELNFDTHVRELCNYGLVEKNFAVELGPESQGYCIHTCLYSWIQTALNIAWDWELGKVALRCIASHVPRKSSQQWWTISRRLLNHAAIYSRALGNEFEADDNFEWDFYNLGDLYINLAKLEEAEQMYNRALRGYERALGPYHLSTLQALNSLGTLYRDQGKLYQAEKMYERELQGIERALGPDHTSTLQTVYNFGTLYRDQGKLYQAERMYERALRGYEKALGPLHPSTLNVADNLTTLHKLPETSTDSSHKDVLHWGVKMRDATQKVQERNEEEVRSRITVSEKYSQKNPYLSETQPSLMPSSFYDPGLGSSLGLNRNEKQDAADTKSIKSTESTVRLNNDVKTSLVDDFVCRLVSETKKQLVSDAELDEIPDLLRDFSITVKRSAQSNVQREAAKFVRRRQRDIADTFQRLVKTLLPLQPSHEVTSDDRMERLFFARAPSISNEFGPASEALEDFEHQHGQEQILGTENAYEYTSAGELQGLESEEHNPEIQQIEDVRHFLLNSIEFQWLSERVRILASSICTGTAYNTVRNTISGHIDSLNSDSTLMLSLQWSPRHFLQDQYAPEDRYLPGALVFCGRVEKSCTCTADEYLQYLWPKIGAETILSFQRACDSRDHNDTVDISGATLSVTLQLNRTYISLSGHAQSMLEIAEASVWLATACRAYDAGDCVACCTPMLKVVSNDLEMIPVFQTLSNGPPPPEGSCWLEMVRNLVIACGYPIPSRDNDSQKGLEVRLEILVALSRARWATTFNNRFLLKGFSSALVPSWVSTSAVVWHYVISKDPGCRMTYNEACESSSVPYLTQPQINELEHQRHFVGIWTPSAKVLAGSMDKNLYELYQSQSRPIEYPTVTLTGLTLSAGKYLNFGGSFILGRKDNALSTARSDDLEFQLGMIEQLKVLFYGDRDCRAWLLDGASALLHLTIAWLAEKGLHEHLTTFQYGQEVNGQPNAKDTLLRNRELPIYTKPESSKMEVVRSQELSQDSHAPVSDSAYFSGSTTSSIHIKKHQKLTTSDWTFEALVIHFLYIMEAMCDKLATKDSTGPQLEIKRPSTVPVLHGWEAKDIILHRIRKGRFHLRSIELQETARDWLKFVDEIGAIVLFAETFGDLIRPAPEQSICNRSWRLPKGRDFLAVPLYVLPIDERSLRSDKNHSRGCVKLTDYTYWHSFEPVLGECLCARGHECRVVSRLDNRERKIDSGQSNPVNVFEEFRDGAAIIGGSCELRKPKQRVTTSSRHSSSVWKRLFSKISDYK